MSSQKNKIKVKTTEDVLKILCESIKTTLGSATQTEINFSPTFIKITKACLRPDIGCFVVFDGGFKGLVAMNFSAKAALEIYRSYYLSMGMPEDELAKDHTSVEVGDSMGELMNQSIGKFRVLLEQQIGVCVNQNQPKMIALSQAMRISLEAEVEKPQYRRVEFRTAGNHRFYLEMITEKADFIMYSPKELNAEPVDPEQYFVEQQSQAESSTKDDKENKEESPIADEEFMKSLGL
jgi:CheY-specific phosphatase CheX